MAESSLNRGLLLSRKTLERTFYTPMVDDAPISSLGF
jgi:hypothetical protein